MANNKHTHAIWSVTKTHWKMVAVFCSAVYAATSILHSWGFFDIPATAQSVMQISLKQEATAKRVNDNTLTLFSVRETIAVSSSKDKEINRRLTAIEGSIATVESDIKDLLKIFSRGRTNSRPR